MFVYIATYSYAWVDVWLIYVCIHSYVFIWIYVCSNLCMSKYWPAEPSGCSILQCNTPLKLWWHMFWKQMLNPIWIHWMLEFRFGLSFKLSLPLARTNAMPLHYFGEYLWNISEKSIQNVHIFIIFFIHISYWYLGEMLWNILDKSEYW